MITPFPVASAPRRSHRRGTRQPYRQGDLDGLCGIYAVINALGVICPELTGKLSERLFKRLVKQLRGRSREPLNFIAGGMGHRTLGHLLAVAIDFVEVKLAIKVKARQLPGQVRTSKRIDDLWRGLTSVLAPDRIAIISVQGRMSHWTVATRIGPKHLFLLDSGDLKRFRRKNCTVRGIEGRYAIAPGEVVIVERAS